MYKSQERKIYSPLSDSDWARVEPLLSESARTRGRPLRDRRGILDAILWVQQTGEKWHRLPSSFPPQQTCYAKFLEWRRAGILQRVAELIDVELSSDTGLLHDALD